MPGFDGTGPAGKGPVTGGGWGDCNVNAENAGRPVGGRPFRNSRFFNNVGNLTNFGGQGRRGGRGSQNGRRMRNRYWATGLPRWMFLENLQNLENNENAVLQQTEPAALRNMAENLKQQLANIEQHIADIEESGSARKE